jgi:AraC-like DNA-binding protein
MPSAGNMVSCPVSWFINAFGPATGFLKSPILHCTKEKTSPLFRFSYSLTTFASLLNGMAAQLGVPMEHDTLHFPETLGEGYMRVVQLPNGLEALIGDFTLRQSMLLERTRGREEYYVFVCDVAHDVRRYYVDIDKDRSEQTATELSAMYLLSFLADVGQFATAGTRLQTVRVVITREWLANYLKMDVLDDVLQRYIAMKARSIHVREVDFESRTLLAELLAPPQDTPLEKTFLQNRVMMILENFFGWLYQQMSVTELQIRMSREEIDQMLRVEEQLLANLGDPPTISQLAKEAAMSPSKLKKQFKDVFGLPVYEYFQKKRMQKARELLLEDRRSIKSVGTELGFSNLSNFSMAFRKEFGELPSEMRKTAALT